jgi:RNA polymerase sigma factor for flagellar operon FliA
MTDEEVVTLSDKEFCDRCAPFVLSIVVELRNTLNLVGDREDMIAAGYLGLVEARSRFEPTTRAEFPTFAYWRIRGAIIDSCRKGSEKSRRYQEKMRAVANHADHVANEHELDLQGARPSGISAASSVTMLAEHVTNVILLAGLASNTEFVFSPATQENRLIESELVTHLKAAMEELSEIDRELLYRLYYLNESTEEVGKHFNHSKSWVSRSHTRILHQLQRYFRRHRLIVD